MISIILKITRSSEDVQFVKRVDTDEYARYFHDKYELTGKYLGRELKLSEDKLSLSIISKWSSRNEYLEYLLDDVVIDNKESYEPLGPEFIIEEYTPNAGEP